MISHDPEDPNDHQLTDIFLAKFQKTNDMLAKFSDRINIKNFENTVNLLYNIDSANNDYRMNNKSLENIADYDGVTTTGRECCAVAHDDSRLSTTIKCSDSDGENSKFVGVKKCHGNCVVPTQTTSHTSDNTNIDEWAGSGNDKCNQFIADGGDGFCCRCCCWVESGDRKCDDNDDVSIGVCKENKFNSKENCENSKSADNKKSNESIRCDASGVGGGDKLNIELCVAAKFTGKYIVAQVECYIFICYRGTCIYIYHLVAVIKYWGNIVIRTYL